MSPETFRDFRETGPCSKAENVPYLNALHQEERNLFAFDVTVTTVKVRFSHLISFFAVISFPLSKEYFVDDLKLRRHSSMSS